MDVQPSQGVREVTKIDNKKDNGPIGVDISEQTKARETAKNEFNASILASTINLSSADAPLSLVLKTALEGINEALQESLGDNAIQNAYESGLDISPEATADRIVSISTGFFSLFQDQHPGLSQEDALAAFISVISDGVEKGFAEARNILNSLQVLEGNIATNIDSTYDLVQGGLSDFVDNYAQNT